MRKKTKIFFILIIIFFIFIAGSFFYLNISTPPYITSIEKSESKKYKDKIIINVHVKNNLFKFNKKIWCLLAEEKNIPDIDDENWIIASNGYCNFTVVSGTYEIFVKDSYGNINNIESQKIKIDKVIQIKPTKDIFYLYKDQKEKINYSLVTLGEPDKKIKFMSENPSIVKVGQDGTLEGLGYGNTNIIMSTSDGVKASIKIYISPFINSPQVKLSKPYLTCKQFSKDEATLIDNILFDRIDNAGFKTRAGVVAAARFITLEFSYKVHYFYENGRLNNYSPYLYVDGEGRYYHRGMYLHSDKYSSIDKNGIFVGPSIWGCDLQNYTNWGPYVAGKLYPNGLDCSGFVTWALLNGGFDIGDIGAGENINHKDLDDLGEKVYITNDLMNSGRVKPGDLIGFNGHMAILTGWDDKNYYIAESLNTTGGVVMTVVPKENLVSRSMYKYIILMDSVYKVDGNLSNTWQ